MKTVLIAKYEEAGAQTNIVVMWLKWQPVLSIDYMDKS